MAKPGDKCPRCTEGLVVRTEVGLACDNCSWEEEIEEVIAANIREKTEGFKAVSFRIRLDDPEEAENFLRGLIVARSNNSSEYFVEMIDAVNEILQPWRAEQLAKELAGRRG